MVTFMTQLLSPPSEVGPGPKKTRKSGSEIGHGPTTQGGPTQSVEHRDVVGWAGKCLWADLGPNQWPKRAHLGNVLYDSV